MDRESRDTFELMDEIERHWRSTPRR